MSRSVVVAETGNPAEAELFRQALAAEDIAAYLDNQEVATTLGHLQAGVGGVKLLVAADDAERAARIVADMRADWTSSAAIGGQWRCPACDEDVPMGHDVCWSCGEHRGDAPASPPPPPSEAAADRAFDGYADRPTKAEVVDVAWRRMWVGLMVPFIPSISSYGALLALPGAQGGFDDRTGVRLAVVVVGNGILLFGWSVFAAFIVSSLRW